MLKWTGASSSLMVVLNLKPNLSILTISLGLWSSENRDVVSVWCKWKDGIDEEPQSPVESKYDERGKAVIILLGSQDVSKLSWISKYDNLNGSCDGEAQGVCWSLVLKTGGEVEADEPSSSI